MVSCDDFVARGPDDCYVNKLKTKNGEAARRPTVFCSWLPDPSKSRKLSVGVLMVWLSVFGKLVWRVCNCVAICGWAALPARQLSHSGRVRILNPRADAGTMAWPVAKCREAGDMSRPVRRYVAITRVNCLWVLSALVSSSGCEVWKAEGRELPRRPVALRCGRPCGARLFGCGPLRFPSTSRFVRHRPQAGLVPPRSIGRETKGPLRRGPRAGRFSASRLSPKEPRVPPDVPVPARFRANGIVQVPGATVR